MSTALDLSKAHIGGEELDQIVLSLVLFSETVWVKWDYDGATEAEARRLVDFERSGMIVPWSYPREPHEQIPDWSHKAKLYTMDETSYDEYAALVVDSIDDYRTRTVRAIPRVADLVDVSNEMWAECLALHLDVGSVVGSRGRAGRLVERLRSADQDVNVVSRFLSHHGLSSGLSALSVDDIVELRRRYSEPMAKMLDDATKALPLSSVMSDSADAEALRRLLLEYDREVADILRSKRPSKVVSASGAVFDLAGIVVSPLGAASALSRVRSYRKTVRSAPLLWFVMDLRARLARQLPSV